MDDKGREIATRVNRLEDNSGKTTKYWVMEKIAGMVSV
jgi:predicted DNA-binding protein